ncbi:DUF1579 domain-containing protein [Ktedonobacter robiniae]|uniref:DUF1579 domain-containing protein n=1 Tax=Ktedonobacter robiniae TaxID=2778365 RepID=A0ABQ3UV85_9CHLR|nr:DUF1579 domain-containing protein [Ktedonobacter robiniae]GHO56580.1 hypothetical protein KSB_50550 [Ktedonobacter robiniae]
MDQRAGLHDFDFFYGSWITQNKRRTNALYRNQEGVWQEFISTVTCIPYLDGRANIDHFEGTLPDGEVRKGLGLRSFDEATQLWSIMWLDNRNPPDLSAVVGKFTDGIGLFYQEMETFDGFPMRVRFLWDNITENTARWQQAFSFDGGATWDTNWIAEHTRKA